MCWLATKNVCPRQKDVHGFPKQSRNQVLGLFVNNKNQGYFCSLKNIVK